MAALTDPGAVARPTSRPCGTAAAYQRGCRCATCREAWRLNSKRRREHRLEPAVIDPTGTQRRIRGLMAMGWTAQRIADASGIHVVTVSSIAVGRCQQVLASTERAIRVVTADLGTRAGPSGITRRRAERLGYVSLWAWDDVDDPAATPAAPVEVDGPDEVAVMRAIHRARADLPPVRLTVAELAVVVPALAVAPVFLTDPQIARRLGVSEFAVAKHRAAAAVPRATHDQQKAAA